VSRVILPKRRAFSQENTHLLRRGAPNTGFSLPAEEIFVPKKELILDFSEYDIHSVVADVEQIRKYNPQRYEMEQLTAICYEDSTNHICVGYKDLGPDEFWVRGHMPGLPLMPGVIMCEAAAQLASYVSHKFKLMEGMIGFGGLEEVRFRGVVRPGDRFVIVNRLLKLRRSIMTCEFQCFVDQNLVCEGILKGVSIPVEQITGQSSAPNNADD
jgi:3-hydroxyacyl-[acyl-carrier-protein] dehydratase